MFFSLQKFVSFKQTFETCTMMIRIKHQLQEEQQQKQQKKKQEVKLRVILTKTRG